jgi:hypothetical protein
MEYKGLDEDELAAELAKLSGGGKRPLTPDAVDAFLAERGIEIAGTDDYEDDEPTTFVARS